MDHPLTFPIPSPTPPHPPSSNTLGFGKILFNSSREKTTFWLNFLAYLDVAIPSAQQETRAGEGKEVNKSAHTSSLARRADICLLDGRTARE